MSMTRTEKKRLAKVNAERRAQAIAAGLPPPPPLSPVKPKSRFAAAIAISQPQDNKVVQMRRRKEAHPVDKLWSADPSKRKLKDEEYTAAVIFRLLHERLETSGKDSIQALLTPGGGGSSTDGWTAAQRDAHKTLTQIKGALPAWEFEIVRKVCGEAWPISDAVHAHSICHKDGVIAAFRNTLQHLSQAISGAQVSWRIVETAKDYRNALAKQNVA